MGTQVQSITKMSRRGGKKKAGQLSRSSLTRSVRLSPSLTPMLPAPLTFVSSRPPCVPLASRSRTRSQEDGLRRRQRRQRHHRVRRVPGMMTGKMGEKDSREDIEKVFKLFDDDNTNKISFRNLARVAEELGENIDDE